MVWHAGSFTRIVYVDVTLTRSNVKVKVTVLLKFLNLRADQGYNLVIVLAGRPQQAVRAGGDDRHPHCGAFCYVYYFGPGSVKYCDLHVYTSVYLAVCLHI